MAQVLFRRQVERAGGPPLGGRCRAISAGLCAREGNRASPEAIQVLAEEAVGLEEHRAVSLHKAIVTEADLILTMTSDQRDYLRVQYPHKAEQTYTIGEFAGNPEEEVLDPYGRGIAAYRACRDQLKIMVDGLLNKIIESKMG